MTAYFISGNAGVAGATLSYNDGTPKTVLANGSGAYSFQVPAGWSGTVTPSKAGYNFSPASMTYANVQADQTGQNFSTIGVLITISGNAGVAGAGATLSYTDGTPKTATADGSGLYSFDVPYNWSGTVTPSLSGRGFIPATRTYTNLTVNQDSQDYSTTTATVYYVDKTNPTLQRRRPMLLRCQLHSARSEEVLTSLRPARSCMFSTALMQRRSCRRT